MWMITSGSWLRGRRGMEEREVKIGVEFGVGFGFEADDDLDIGLNILFNSTLEYKLIFYCETHQ